MKKEINQQNIVTEVWKLASALSAAGVSASDYIQQLTYLLF